MATVPNLVALSLSEMLLRLRSERAAGRLSVRHGRFATRVYFIDGTVVAVATDDPSYDLAPFLVREGILSPAAEAAAVRLARRSHRPVDDVLIKTGAADLATLDACRQRHAMEVLAALDLDEQPELDFEADVLPEEVSGDLALGVHELLDERQRRRAATARIKQHFGAEPLSVTKLGYPAEDVDAAERHLLDVLEGPLGVEAVCAKAGLGRWAALDGLARLAEKGAVEFCAEHGVAPSTDRVEPVEEGESAETWIGLGRGFIEKGRLEESIEAFRQAVAAEPTNTRARQILDQAELLVCSMLQRQEPALAAGRLRVVTEPDVRMRAELSSLDSVLLTLIGDGRDLKAVITAAPVAEVDVLLGVRRLRERGLLAATA